MFDKDEKCEKNTYACYGIDINERLYSSSGGLFSIIARKAIGNNGIVYGVAMSEDCYSAEYIGITDINELYRLRGSKYFQAKVGNTYKKIKEDLHAGRFVLFSGTGCQVNGLKRFIGKEYDNLLCVDIICHGVPSPKLWMEYVKYQEKKYGKLESVNFRCKDNGWQSFGMKENVNGNQLFVSHDRDPFMRMFLRNHCLRPSCYNCHAKYYKKSDMTIADFWGIESVAPEMNDDKGTSLVIIRTDKGQKLFESIKSDLRWKEVSYEDGVRDNPSEYSSVERPTTREAFFVDLDTIPFEEMEMKYAADIKVSLVRRAKNKTKGAVEKVVKVLLSVVKKIYYLIIVYLL